jgi:3-oxoadipate enol-lactonase
MNMTIIRPGDKHSINNKQIKKMRTPGDNLKININDLSVNYDDNGPVYAPAVVFIHGTPFNKGIWDLQAEALRNNYRVITYDLRGHGGTTGGNIEDMSIDDLTDDLIGFLDALELKKVILCGISSGGNIALNAIEKYPERFYALALTSTQCNVDNAEMITERERLLEVLNVKGPEKYTEAVMKDLFAATSFTTRKEEVRTVRKMITENRAEAIRGAMKAMASRRESCSNLWGIQMPVLIMAGKEDVITPVDVAQFMRDNISGSTLHVIDYAGHLVNLENTHEYNRLFRLFVEHVCEKKHLSPHCTNEYRQAARGMISGNKGL